jgi:hypothetical protein
MRVAVESYAGYRGAEMLRNVRLDGRNIEIAENIDQWHGAGYRYHKVKGRDGNLYILRLDEGRGEWELTMFQRPEAAEPSIEGTTGIRRRGNGAAD